MDSESEPSARTRTPADGPKTVRSKCVAEHWPWFRERMEEHDGNAHDLVLEFDGGAPGAVVEGVALADVDGRIAYVSISAPWPSQAN